MVSTASLTALAIAPRIYFAERPLREDHLKVLEYTKLREKSIALAAGWAAKEYALVLEQVFSQCMDPYVLDRLGFDKVTNDEGRKQQNQTEAELFIQLLISMVSTRAWSMAAHSICHPDKWAGALHIDQVLAKKLFLEIQQDANTILTALRKLSEPDPNTDKEAGIKWSVKGTMH